MSPARLLLVWALCCGLTWVAPARAEQGAFDVAGELAGVPLGRSLGLYEDGRGGLSVEQIAAQGRARFRASSEPAPGFGYTHAVYWLRLPVQNSSSSRRIWLLELAYPLLDHVTLYVPMSGGGYEERATGDMVPFMRRDLAHRNFVFSLEEPPHSARTYYLRVATTGSMTLPLLAWTVRPFMDQQLLDWAGLCVFYGVVFGMGCYSACLYLFTRQREYLYFALTVLIAGLFQFTFSGHTFQYLLPDQPWLAQRALPASMAAGLIVTCLFGRSLMREYERSQFGRSARLFQVMLFASVAVALISLPAPYRVAVQLLSGSMLVYGVAALVLSLRVVRVGASEGRLNLLAWACPVCGVAVAVLRAAGVLPNNALTAWSVQIGVSLQFVLLASGLAGRLNTMRAQLGGLNAELSHKVAALERAVRRAEQATETAERVNRVKDEFMATMSHELRTPLNTIINVPAGLIEDFPARDYRVCAACGATFLLEPDERVAPETSCPECQRPATLRAAEVAAYAGQPRRTVQYLERIERSGMHLLEVLNGMLGADRTRAGLLALTLEHVDVLALARQVVEEMSFLAERSGVKLALVSAPAPIELSVDRLRLRQVLLNLIGNAIKFSDGHGQVTVSVEERPDGCLFSVVDQGIGIAPENLASVFGSFEQVHPGGGKYGGTGLGLSIARSLVRLHGGEIWAESEVGRGATFRFHLPRHASERLSAVR